MRANVYHPNSSVKYWRDRLLSFPSALLQWWELMQNIFSRNKISVHWFLLSRNEDQVVHLKYNPFFHMELILSLSSHLLLCVRTLLLTGDSSGGLMGFFVVLLLFWGALFDMICYFKWVSGSQRGKQSQLSLCGQGVTCQCSQPQQEKVLAHQWGEAVTGLWSGRVPSPVEMGFLLKHSPARLPSVIGSLLTINHRSKNHLFLPLNIPEQPLLGDFIFSLWSGWKMNYAPKKVWPILATISIKQRFKVHRNWNTFNPCSLDRFFISLENGHVFFCCARI